MNNNLSQAYIIEYRRGTDADALIRRIVQFLVCENPVYPDGSDNREAGQAGGGALLSGIPCGHCPACRRVAAGSHEDVIEMERTGKLQYRVDDAAKFIERLGMNPANELNIGIVREAELMSEVVQNKLLKTLEEPMPGTVILLFTSNRERLLSTVRSRCVLVRPEAGGEAKSGLAEDDGDMPQAVRELLDEFFEGSFFYKYRSIVEKRIKDRDEALRFLDIAEQRMRDGMMRNIPGMAAGIEAAERTRKDVILGMGYKQALKRLYLEVR